ncbi:MAG: tyrosine-type recombinase/integrase [Candidatus Dormibacteria bacterium]
MSALTVTVQAFFTQRLAQRDASPHTVAAYRDSFRLLLSYVHTTTGVAPNDLDLNLLGPERIGSFLEYLEKERHASVATRNARLAAIHSLFRFAALRHPEHMDTISRVLAIPPKRTAQSPVCFLTIAEAEALIAAPNRSRWTGRRDHALLLLAVQTGLRVSELTALRVGDVHLGTGSRVDTVGKGRKHRATPLTAQTAGALRTWLAERGGSPEAPAFPGPRGARLTRDAVRHAVTRYVVAATRQCPSLAGKRVGVHTLRHTAAMRLLEAGVDTSVIAMWLGHASPATTQVYLHAHLALKERAIARTAPLNTPPGRYRPPDQLLAFLEAL